MTEKWIQALKSGSEIVIISAELGDDSAIFWMDRNDTIHSFNRSFGVMKRPDMDVDRLKEHLQTMHEEGASIFVRGFRN